MDGRNKNQKDLVISILLAAYTHTRKNVIIYFADLTCIISYYIRNTIDKMIEI